MQWRPGPHWPQTDGARRWLALVRCLRQKQRVGGLKGWDEALPQGQQLTPLVHCREDNLRAAFAPYGNVQSVKVIRDKGGELGHLGMPCMRLKRPDRCQAAAGVWLPEQCLPGGPSTPCAVRVYVQGIRSSCWRAHRRAGASWGQPSDRTACIVRLRPVWPPRRVITHPSSTMRAPNG